MYNLDMLLEGMTDSNRHEEFPKGEPAMGGRWHKLDLELATEQYLSGWTLTQIAEEHGVAVSTVHLRLTKAGVPIRDAVSAQIFWSKNKKKRPA